MDIDDFMRMTSEMQTAEHMIDVTPRVKRDESTGEDVLVLEVNLSDLSEKILESNKDDPNIGSFKRVAVAFSGNRVHEFERSEFKRRA